MFRRSIQQQPRIASTLGNSVRAYTDYHHHKYPTMTNLVMLSNGGLLAAWLLFLSAGSMWFASNREWKSDVARSWKRQLGTGYRWSDEVGPMIETIYVNLPDRAE